ncbi:hypothetical protein COCNU_14G008530 [Cocos nucifera]|uniref:Uncharacterized protein n=1 Tax=Cocos nucifera TaxID=13894 RepID=A0A8K0IVH8_COCNU|nr:hypothetical protein COCNU_14G008530 [Cocos nucifera]
MDSAGKVATVTTNLVMEAAVKIAPMVSPVCDVREAKKNLSEGATETVVIDNLRIAAEFLESRLYPIDRRALVGEDAQHLAANAFRSLALVGHYLANFAGVAEFSPLELVEVKGDLEKFKYYLEQKKAANADLVKKIDCSERALSKAREVIDRRDDELSRAHRRIEILERQKFEAERDCRRAHDDIKHLRRMLEERREQGPSPHKALGPKIPQKRRVDATGGRSTHPQVVRVPCGLDLTVPEGSHETSVECLFSDTILSLPAHNVSDLFLKEELVNEEETIETAVDGTPFTEGAEIFKTVSGGTSKAVLGKESVIELANYLNGFIKNTVDLSDKATRFEVEVTILKRTKDQLSKVSGKTFDRTEATKKKAQDAEAALMRVAEENARLLSINKILEAEVEELKARVTRAKASEVEALPTAKIVEEKVSKAVDDFRASKEFRKEKASFALDTYDEGKCIICDEVAAKYPGLDMGFLDEAPRAFDSKDSP